jgi:hypothetical protein
MNAHVCSDSRDVQASPVNAEHPGLPADLFAGGADAAWSWPYRSAAVMAEQLAELCEQLALLLQAGLEAPASREDGVARSRLNYVYGSTLLTLAERETPALLPHAVQRLGDALSLARRHAPEHVVAIKSQLLRAEHSLALRQQSDSGALRR